VIRGKFGNEKLRGDEPRRLFFARQRPNQLGVKIFKIISASWFDVGCQTKANASVRNLDND
jgi:hypothetical protein